MSEREGNGREEFFGDFLLSDKKNRTLTIE